MRACMALAGLAPLRAASRLIRNSGTAPSLQLSSSSITRPMNASTTGNCAIISGSSLDARNAESVRGGRPVEQRHVRFRTRASAWPGRSRARRRIPGSALRAPAFRSGERADTAAARAPRSLLLSSTILGEGSARPAVRRSAYEYSVKPLVAASSRPVCLGDSASRLSISFSANGSASPTRSGSSSLSKVEPPDASALPELVDRDPLDRAAAQQGGGCD